MESIHLFIILLQQYFNFNESDYLRKLSYESDHALEICHCKLPDQPKIVSDITIETLPKLYEKIELDTTCYFIHHGQLSIEDKNDNFRTTFVAFYPHQLI